MQAIDDMLYRAGTYGGVVFGGFVRDVIVPQIIDPSCEVKFNDVDLWFQTETLARNFVQSMSPNLELIQTPDIQPPSWLNVISTSADQSYASMGVSDDQSYSSIGISADQSYSSIGVSDDQIRIFGELLEEMALEVLGLKEAKSYTESRPKFILYQDGKFVTEVDIIISQKYPADDVNISGLSYRYDIDNSSPVPLVEGKLLPVDSKFLKITFESIRRKEVTILPKYLERLYTGLTNPTTFSRCLCDRLIQKYLQREWTLLTPNGISINAILDSRTEWPAFNKDHKINDIDRFEFVSAIRRTELIIPSPITSYESRDSGYSQEIESIREKLLGLSLYERNAAIKFIMTKLIGDF